MKFGLLNFMIASEIKGRFMIALSLQQRVCASRRDLTKADSSISDCSWLCDATYTKSFEDIKVNIGGDILAHPKPKLLQQF